MDVSTCAVFLITEWFFPAAWYRVTNKNRISTNSCEKRAGCKMRKMYMPLMVLWKASTWFTHRETIMWQLSIVLATPVRHRMCAESTDSLFTNTHDYSFLPAKKETGVTGLGSLTLFISPLHLPGPFQHAFWQAHIFWVPGLCTSFILL